jgi:hypothetical protein
MIKITAPLPEEYPEHFDRYIKKVTGNDLIKSLAEIHQQTKDVLKNVAEEKLNYRYAPGKWTIKEIIGHIADQWTNLARLVTDDQIADARLAPRGLKQGGEDFDRRGLARAVGPDEPEAVAFVDFEVEVRQRDQRAVALGEIHGLDDGNGH